MIHGYTREVQKSYLTRTEYVTTQGKQEKKEHWESVIWWLNVSKMDISSGSLKSCLCWNPEKCTNYTLYFLYLLVLWFCLIPYWSLFEWLCMRFGRQRKPAKAEIFLPEDYCVIQRLYLLILSLSINECLPNTHTHHFKLFFTCGVAQGSILGPFEAALL